MTNTHVCILCILCHYPKECCANGGNPSCFGGIIIQIIKMIVILIIMMIIIVVIIIVILILILIIITQTCIIIRIISHTGMNVIGMVIIHDINVIAIVVIAIIIIIMIIIIIIIIIIIRSSRSSSMLRRHLHLPPVLRGCGCRQGSERGTNGVSTNEVIAMFMF